MKSINWVVTLVLFLGIATSFGCKKKESNAESNRAPILPEKEISIASPTKKAGLPTLDITPVATISAETIVSDYLKDKSAADLVYKGKAFTLEGTLEAIRLDDWSKPSIQLFGAEVAFDAPFTVNCRFNPSEFARVKDMKFEQLQKFTIRGKCSGRERDVWFTDCQLISTAPRAKLPTDQELNQEIDRAIAGKKFVKMELNLPNTTCIMDVPAGAVVTPDNYNVVIVTQGDRFRLNIKVGRVFEFVASGLPPRSLVADLPSTRLRRLFSGFYLAEAIVRVGYQDFAVSSDRFAKHSREDCLIVLHCARSLKVKPETAKKESKQALMDLRANLNERDGKVVDVQLVGHRIGPSPEKQCVATDSSLELLKLLPDLESLTINSEYITNEGLALHLPELGALKSLKLISRRENCDSVVAALASSKALKTLNLSICSLTNKGVANAAKIAQLEELDLSISDGELVDNEGLAHLKDLKNLHSLELSLTDIDDDGLDQLREFKALRKLRLCNSSKRKHFTDNSIEKLKKLNNLEEIDLSETSVTPKGIDALQQALPNAKILYRQNNK